MYNFSEAESVNSASNPLVNITLTSSHGDQKIASGSKRVTMATYEVVNGFNKTVSLNALPIKFQGDTAGIKDCRLRDAKTSLTSTINPADILLAAEYTLVPLSRNTLIPGDVKLELRLICDISMNAVGERYTWGVGGIGDGLTDLKIASFEGDVVQVKINLARSPSGGTGNNGVLFEVIKSDIKLDSAEFEDIRLSSEDKAFAPKEISEATITFKNTGGTTWIPEKYALVPTKSTSAKNWDANHVGRYGLPRVVLPGQTISLKIPLIAPQTAQMYRVGWHLVRGESPNEIVQNPSVLVLQVVDKAQDEAFNADNVSLFNTVGEAFKSLGDNLSGIIGINAGSGGGSSSGSQGSTDSKITSPMNDTLDDKGNKIIQKSISTDGDTTTIYEYCEEVPDATEYCDDN
ncbi:MAG: hypothetical protein HZA95_00410 [Candidatus Vogelbacteria bacterium]|nr:hypothetical protein [Candidatus Vogelbacteria bacterium]